jgi:hypothetical protein
MKTWSISILLGVALATLAGCASIPTASVPASTPLPASPIATGEGSDLHVVVQAVVSPGNRQSWAHGASWDEYAMRVANHSGAPLVIEGALLVDVRGAELAPGDHPGNLEKLSKKRWTRYFREGVPVDPHAADPVAAARAAANRNVPAQIIGWTLFCIAPPAVLLGATSAAVVAYGSDRSAVKQEFQRRRLKLPLSLAVGHEASGSFFFPVTPGPQRLVLAYRRDGQLHREEIALPALAHLHLPVPPVVAQNP